MISKFNYCYIYIYENFQDGNKGSESNIPLAHDLICVQHQKKQTLLHL